MNHRVALVAGAAIVVGGAAYLLRPTSQAAQATAPRSSKIAVRDVETVREPPPPPAKLPMVLTESGWQPQTARQPRQWIDPVSGAVNREVVDAVPDPAATAAEELKYRKSRLRLTLSDHAASCWTGGDSKEEIELEYTLIVQNQVIRTDNVRVKTSNITNPTVERCIVDSVRDLRMSADRIPDLREDQGLIMSLHDLYDRNLRETRSRTPDGDAPAAVDRPTATPPAE
jgi:hypothetical protein